MGKFIEGGGRLVPFGSGRTARSGVAVRRYTGLLLGDYETMLKFDFKFF